MMHDTRTALYWDCGCEAGYICPSTQAVCSKCGAKREDCEDSIEVEVRQAGYPIETPADIAAENARTEGPAPEALMVAILDNDEEQFFAMRDTMIEDGTLELLEAELTRGQPNWDPHFE